jgi:hypothetical protein
VVAREQLVRAHLRTVKHALGKALVCGSTHSPAWHSRTSASLSASALCAASFRSNFLRLLVSRCTLVHRVALQTDRLIRLAP